VNLFITVLIDARIFRNNILTFGDLFWALGLHGNGTGKWILLTKPA
jgi:hypothetical protein